MGGKGRGLLGKAFGPKNHIRQSSGKPVGSKDPGGPEEEDGSPWGQKPGSKKKGLGAQTDRWAAPKNSIKAGRDLRGTCGELKAPRAKPPSLVDQGFSSAPSCITWDQDVKDW